MVKRRVATERAIQWRWAMGAFAVLAALLIGLYWSTVVSLVEIWANTGMFRYCFLIFPITGWLVWNQRHELAAHHTPTPCWWALPLLAGTIFVWFVARITSVDVVQQAAFVATFPVLVLLVFGTGAFRALLFPMLYLVFAIPAGHSAVAPLQRITAEISVQVLHWTNVPVLLQGGHFIITPSATWEVARACSGIRFFTACTAIGSLFAYLFFTSYWRRTIFIIASMIVPIIANGLRVYFTILIGETFGLQYAQGTDHMIFGWQFFGTVLFLLLLVGWFLREPPRKTPEPDDISTGGTRGSGFKQVFPAALAAAVILVAAPAWSGVIRASVTPKVMPGNIVLKSAGDWSRGTGLSSSRWEPLFVGADYRVAGRYIRSSDSISLYVAAYDGAQISGHDLLAYDNDVFDPERWHTIDNGRRVVALSGGGRLAVRQVLLQRGAVHRLIWYWYRVNGSTYTSSARVRGSQAWAQVRGIPLYSDVVAVSETFVRGGKVRAKAGLAAFVDSLRSPLANALAGVRQEGRHD